MIKLNDKEYHSESGMVFQHKETKVIFGWGISLGVDDSIDNYEEIDCPKRYKGNRDYDNLIKDKDVEQVNKSEYENND